MKPNKIKQIMRDGGLAIVSHVGFADPAVVEIIASAGFDGAFIDMEHSMFDLQTVGEMIRVADLCDITPVVRVPDENPGAEGARKAVEAVRYPPVGERGGAGSSRAAGYGAVPWQEHMRTSNEEILLIVMTEDKKGLAEIAEIAAVDGVDLISLGPTDISAALGFTDPADPKLREIFVDLAAKVKAVDKAKVYIPVNHAACRFTPQDLLEMGVNYTSVAPAPQTIVLNALKAAAKNIREEAAKT